MNKKFVTLSLTTVVVLGLALTLFVGTAAAVSGAVSTTDNPGWTDSYDSYVNVACKNGNGTNCNIYADKRDVWLSGLPVSSALGAGTYFFAVLDPGGQNDPNDGSTGNLSSSHDSYANRTFSVDGSGNITSYSGTHDRDGNKLQLYPYDNTANPGGVYILAVCQYDPNNVTDSPGVDPSKCKYDAFKVGEGPSQGLDLTVSKTATPSLDWGISKSVDKTEIDTSGGSVTFNYTVTVTHGNWQVNGTITVMNPNLFDVAGVSVTDAINDANATCTVTGGSNVTVPGNGSINLPYTCTYSAAPGADNQTNTATATWPDINSPDTTGTGTAAVTWGSVTVTDTLGGTLGTIKATDPSPTTFTYPYSFSDDPAGTCTTHNNTATIVETNQSASASVKVCVGADLTVSKTATPSFTRTFHWGITKAVDKTYVRQLSGSVTFNYTVNVTHDAGTDSAWAVNGTITVANPNDWESITTDVTDAIPGGTCTVTNGTGVSIPASGSVTRNYSCTFGSNPGSGTNTATATWDNVTSFTPDSSATGTAGFAFGAPTTLVDNCVTVTDSIGGSLGSACNTDPSPKTFTYSKTVNVPTNDTCTTVNNTATFTTNTTGTTGSASQRVTVCGAAKGGLTMGFWQNKNGQSIITGGASTGGICNSGTWLRNYAPFQDLSATANCSTVATYVTNIIKAANASGSSMNAMLKAQMLATALDVYFSDPTLGGDKIAAYNGGNTISLGGVKIDLTMICKMIDGSGGTGTCSGTYQNVSSAFGGATSLTVSQMLAYAANQSNSGGSVWYGQVKATQEMAKNAFDAINNQVAFVAP